MKKPIIGIVGRPDIDELNEYDIYVYEHYRKAIIKNNAIPFLILPTQDLFYSENNPSNTKNMIEDEKNDLIEILKKCDGILMPGGNRWYEYDEFISKYAIENDIPLLGICLGMQLMANTFNEDFTDRTEKIESYINHCKTKKEYVHKVKILKDTYLEKIINKNLINVNSSHKYKINSAKNFIISAYSEDGIIEAIEYPNKKFIVGVQWHPEVIEDENSKEIFKIFIKKAK